jgi:hypothetical protein
MTRDYLSSNDGSSIIRLSDGLDIQSKIDNIEQDIAGLGGGGGDGDGGGGEVIINLTNFENGIIDNDATLTSNSNLKLPTQYAVKTYVDTTINNLNIGQYATETYVDTTINNLNIGQYVTETYVNNALSNYTPEQYPIQTVTTNTVLTGSVFTTLVNCTLGNITITLPDATTGNYIQNIKKIDLSSNIININTLNSQTIDGDLIKIIDKQYTSISLHSNGSNWFII